MGDDLKKLQKRGFYCALYALPNGNYSMYICRWDDMDDIFKWHRSGDALGPIEAVQWFMDEADKYEEGL